MNLNDEHSQIYVVSENKFVKELIIKRGDFLKRFHYFILDEAHNISVHTLLMLGVLRKYTKVETERKLIITSATMDLEYFEEYFSNCKLRSIESMTPLFNVQKFYSPYPTNLDDIEARVLLTISQVFQVFRG